MGKELKDLQMETCIRVDTKTGSLRGMVSITGIMEVALKVNL